MSDSAKQSLLRCTRWGMLLGAPAGAALGWMFAGFNIGPRALFLMLVGVSLGTGFGLITGFANGFILPLISHSLAKSFAIFVRFKRHLAVSAFTLTAWFVVMIFTAFTVLTIQDPVSDAMIGLFPGIIGGFAALYAAHRNASWFWSTHRKS